MHIYCDTGLITVIILFFPLQDVCQFQHLFGKFYHLHLTLRIFQLPCLEDVLVKRLVVGFSGACGQWVGRRRVRLLHTEIRLLFTNPTYALVWIFQLSALS